MDKLLEYIIIMTYMCFLLLVGFVFKRLTSNVNDYFRGGCRGTWWLVGISSFRASRTIGYFISLPVSRFNKPEHDEKVGEFFTTMNTPVDFEKEVGQANDLRQLKLLGTFAIALGVFISLLVIPAFILPSKSLLGIICPLAVGGILMFLGSVMIFFGKGCRANNEPVMRV